MDIDLCGCDKSELSFMCCVTLADLAQAAGDAGKAEFYIELAYAAMDRRHTASLRAPIANDYRMATSF